MKHLFRIKRKAVIKNSTTRLPDHLWLGYVKVLVWLYDIPSAHRTYFFELLNRIQSLRRNSGDTWTVGYLKESHRLSSHWLSGNPDVCSGSIRVSVRGLPLIIPGRLRNVIYSRNNINITRALLTLLSTFRVMSATPKLKLSTITDPFNGVNETLPSLEVSRALKNILQGNKFHFKKEDIKDPYSVNRLMDITKADPNGGVSLRNVIIDAYALMKHPKVYASLFKDLFLDYALLGDDICIANKAVADNYLLIMRDLGVEINLSKSLISSTGVVEFAKRWRVGQTDVSPASPALITRLLSNMNYLPVLILDLVNRGVKTIQNSEKLLSLSDSLHKIKKSITFSLIPYYDSEFAKCLLPLKGKDKSFSQKELFALYVHTDRIFNKLGLLEFHKAKDGDQENSKLSQSYLYNILDNSKLPLPAITSQIDNILIAQMKTITNVPTRNWLNNRDINLLTFECWHSYLIDTLSELSSISKVVPDYTIIKDNEKPDNLEMRRNLLFMQELIKDLKKWNPGIFEIIPESILKEEEV
uniref:RNA-dependent RNA polymerase n=20 Tax=Mitoviridae TaxID=2732892 RepID=A9XN83_9VIRU|nr:RNA-dependent RNA polymerase [Botrytis cinerea mitovirus 1 S]